jgi:hypothetical protein
VFYAYFSLRSTGLILFRNSNSFDRGKEYSQEFRLSILAQKNEVEEGTVGATAELRRDKFDARLEQRLDRPHVEG